MVVDGEVVPVFDADAGPRGIVIAEHDVSLGKATQRRARQRGAGRVKDFNGRIERRAEPAAVRHGGMLEAFFDDTQIEVAGRRFEGAKINYDGNLALSWQMLWVGPFLADAIMGSPAQQKEAAASAAHGQDVSAWLPTMLEANRGLWQDVPSYLYADSASSAGKYLESIDAHFTRWSVSYNKWTGPLEAGEAVGGDQSEDRRAHAHEHVDAVRPEPFALYTADDLVEHLRRSCHAPSLAVVIAPGRGGAGYIPVRIGDLGGSARAPFRRTFHRRGTGTPAGSAPIPTNTCRDTGAQHSSITTLS